MKWYDVKIVFMSGYDMTWRVRAKDDIDAAARTMKNLNDMDVAWQQLHATLSSDEDQVRLDKQTL